MEDEITQILAVLDSAFGELKAPSDDEIVYDNSGYHLECNEIRAKFRRRHWRDLHAQDLEGEGDALYFFTTEAFRFFLPAFIRASLLDPVRADLITDCILNSLARPDLTTWWDNRGEAITETLRQRGIPDKVLVDITAHEEPGLDAGCWRRVAALNEQQRGAVIDFVAFLRTHRREEFVFGQLDLVEQALQGRLSSEATGDTEQEN